MPSAPTINVNLKPCDCDPGHEMPHSIMCVSQPVSIPLSLQPFRSVTFTVRLGTCCCIPIMDIVTVRPDHRADCPARPIRVTCSISGETWEESNISGWELADRTHPPIPVAHVLGVCEQRWETLVKALVLGGRLFPSPVSDAVVELVAQRDTVYAAICAMAQVERAMGPAHIAMFKALDAADAAYAALGPSSYPDAPFATRGLAAYVKRLVELVGALP